MIVARLLRHLLPVLATLSVSAAAAPAAAPRLEVHFIDVGQGDGMIIRTPGGKTVLIDAGNIEAGEVVDAYLAKLGIAALDLVIVSHPHLDHMGGMLEVLKRHRPTTYLDPGYPHPLENYDQLLDWLEAESIPVKVGRAGRTITLEPGITLELVAPSEPFFKDTRSDANSNSVVARLVYGKVSFLFTGDSEDETEQRLLSSGGPLHSTVLKVAHHGGRHSTSDRWLASVQPAFAVISCGQINGYGHPRQETLDRLESVNARVFRTDKDGDVIAKTDGATIDWTTTGDASAKLDEPGGKRSLARGGPSSRNDHPSERVAPDVAPEPKGLVDVNTATQAQLESLPGIGSVAARLIIEERTRTGRFADLDALLRIRGIGRGTIEKLRPLAEARAGEPAMVTTPAVVAVKPPPVRPPEEDLPPPPAVVSDKAAVPVARPTLAYRTTSRVPAPVRSDDSAGGGGMRRLLSVQRRWKVNLNLASAEAIARTTGLPMDQASRVVAWREANGPFHAISDVRSVSGLEPAEQARLIGAASVRLDLNRVTSSELEALGLTSTEASSIVNTRASLGRFANIDELEEIESLSPASRLKVLPLLSVEQAQPSWGMR